MKKIVFMVIMFGLFFSVHADIFKEMQELGVNYRPLDKAEFDEVVGDSYVPYMDEKEFLAYLNEIVASKSYRGVSSVNASDYTYPSAYNIIVSWTHSGTYTGVCTSIWDAYYNERVDVALVSYSYTAWWGNGESTPYVLI